jgi:hypothetical protein
VYSHHHNKCGHGHRALPNILDVTKCPGKAHLDSQNARPNNNNTLKNHYANLHTFSPNMMLLKSLLLLTMTTMSQSTSLRGSADVSLQQRRLATPYYSTADVAILGASNPDAAIGNPLKGLVNSPWWQSSNPPTSVPNSLEHYYIGLDKIMTGANQFNWSVLDGTLAGAASRNNHVIWRVYCHYPSYPLAVPQYLLDAGTKLVTMSNGDVSPLYDDPILLNGLNQFITAFGARYDGHKSLGFIQLGLLGEWCVASSGQSSVRSSLASYTHTQSRLLTFAGENGTPTTPASSANQPGTLSSVGTLLPSRQQNCSVAGLWVRLTRRRWAFMMTALRPPRSMEPRTVMLL